MSQSLCLLKPGFHERPRTRTRMSTNTRAHTNPEKSKLTHKGYLRYIIVQDVAVGSSKWCLDGTREQAHEPMQMLKETRSFTRIFFFYYCKFYLRYIVVQDVGVGSSKWSLDGAKFEFYLVISRCFVMAISSFRKHIFHITSLVSISLQFDQQLLESR